MSNLIAVKNSSNEVGLGTSYIGLGSTGTSVLPFKVDETNAILMNFNTSNNSINLGTINSGVWQGSPIEIEYGGLGNIASGSANQILAVNSQGNGYNWINNQLDISTNTEIATNVTSAVGIGSTSHDLTINTSKLNINIGNTTPQEGQVLKYTNDSLIWSDANLVSIDKLWTLMKTLHPGYVMFLKSIQVLNNGASAGTLVPIFNPTITNYDVNVGSNTSVAIVPTTFSFPSGTTITTTQIDDNAINNPNEYVLVDLNNTYNIKNSYTENSETHTKTYTLNITRNTSSDNNINSLVLKESVSQNTKTLNELANNIYEADVDTIQDIEILLEVNRTVKAINLTSNSSSSQLNITKNNNSIIGTSSAFIGIDSTSNSNDINISSGRITDVIFQITAENDSTKPYTLKISNPPRNNAEVNKITITKIDLLNSPAPDLDVLNPSPGNISNLSISEQYNSIRFSIDRKNSSQNTKIFKNNIEQTIDPSTINLITTNSIIFSSYNNTIPSTSNSITDTFKIVNISPDGNTTNNYEVSCPIEKSSNKIPESIIIYTGSDSSNIDNQLFKIDTDTDLSNTNHTTTKSAILSLNSVNIEVIRNGGQQITLLHNTSGINHTDNIPFYVNGDNNTSFKTINLNNSNVYNFVLEVTAENNSDRKTYNIIINTDNVSPQVQSFTLSDTTLKINETCNVTIVFTEEIQDLINISITVNGGTLDNRSANQANTILTGTFNPLSNSTISGRITVESGYKDSAGNEQNQAQASALITIDTTSLILQEYTDSSTTLSSSINFTNPVYKFSSNKNLNINDISIAPPDTNFSSSNYSITSSGTTIISGNTSYIYKIAFINLSNGSTYNKSIIASDHVGNITMLGIPSFTIDTTPIILANSQVIGTTRDNTPIYKFTSNKVGTLTYTSNNNLSLSNNGLTNNSTVSNGVNTIEFNTINNNANYSGEQITVTDNSGNTTNLIIPDFIVHVGTYQKYLSGYSSYGSGRLYNFQDAVDAMEQTSDAGGITYNISNNYYTIRLGTILYNSPNEHPQTSWLKSELMSFSNPPPTGDVSLGYIYNYNSHTYSYGVGTLTFDAFLRNDLTIGWTNMTNTTSGITPYKWYITPTTTPNLYNISNTHSNTLTQVKIIYQLTDNNNKYYLVVNNSNNQIIKPNFLISGLYISFNFKSDILENNYRFESSETASYNSSISYPIDYCWIINSFTNFPIPSTYPTRLDINNNYRLKYPEFLMSPNNLYVVYLQGNGSAVFSRRAVPGGAGAQYLTYTDTWGNGDELYINSNDGKLHVSQRSNPSFSRFISNNSSSISYMEVKNDGTFKGYGSDGRVVYTFGVSTNNNNTAPGTHYGHRHT